MEPMDRHTADADYEFVDLLTVSEAAKISTVPRSSLYEMAARRRRGEKVGPPILELGPGRIRWRRSDLVRWVRECER